MTDAVPTPAAPEPQPTPAQASAPTEPQAPPSTTADDLAALFAEFDEATKPKEEPKAVPQEPPADPTKDIMAEFDKSLGVMGMSAELRQHLQTYATTVAQMQAQQQYQQNKADFESIASKFDKAARDAGLSIAEDHASRWLLAESVMNPQLEAAFDHRHDSPAHLRRFEKLVKKTQERFIASARAPDPQATADRAAVVWAVRNTSSVAPPPKPVSYGDLSDAEFALEKKRHGIG